MDTISFKRHRFPPEIIRRAVWLYARFTLSYRDVEDLLAERVPDGRDNYVGKKITVHDNRGICAHSARCTDTLKSVFLLGQEPWIDPDGEEAKKIAAAVEQCPSGALSYTVEGVEHRDWDSEPMILVVPNGPYAVRGGASLEDAQLGEGASKEHFTLCRCGQSKNKPFCSGAHWYHHFDEHAPPRASS